MVPRIFSYHRSSEVHLITAICITCLQIGHKQAFCWRFLLALFTASELLSYQCCQVHVHLVLSCMVCQQLKLKRIAERRVLKRSTCRP